METFMQFETSEDAINWRKIDRKKLVAGNKRQRRVARTLTNCRKTHRCGTEGCRVCMREFRVGWAGEAVKILLQRPLWTRCSIITKGLLVPYGQLANFDLNAVIKRRSGYVGNDGNHRTKHQRLKGPDIRKLLPFLAKHKVGARLLLAGVRRNGHRLFFTPTKPSSHRGKQ